MCVCVCCLQPQRVVKELEAPHLELFLHKVTVTVVFCERCSVDFHLLFVALKCSFTIRSCKQCTCRSKPCIFLFGSIQKVIPILRAFTCVYIAANLTSIIKLYMYRVCVLFVVACATGCCCCLCSIWTTCLSGTPSVGVCITRGRWSSTQSLTRRNCCPFYDRAMTSLCRM